MTTVLHMSINFSALKATHGDFCKKPIYCSSVSGSKIGSLRQNGLKPRVSRRERWFSLGGSWGRDRTFVEDEGWKRKRRVVLVRFNQGFGFNGGGGGGGGRDNARLLGNIALAIGLTYLSVTGQLGWVFDAIVSIWLIVVLIPIVGLGAFIWWAGRDIIQGQCPNCGNDFQVFKSTLNDELQLCPFCSQPFSVVDNEFVSDPVKFSNQSTTFGEAFRDFTPGFKKGKDTSATIVDVEAEIEDAD